MRLYIFTDYVLIVYPKIFTHTSWPEISTVQKPSPSGRFKWDENKIDAGATAIGSSRGFARIYCHILVSSDFGVFVAYNGLNKAEHK